MTQRQSDGHEALERKEESKNVDDDTTSAPLAGLAVVAATAPASTGAGEDDEAHSATHIPGSTDAGAAAARATTSSHEAESAHAGNHAAPASPKEADKVDPTAPAPASPEKSKVVESPAEVTSPPAIPKEAEEVDPTAPAPVNPEESKVVESPAEVTSPPATPKEAEEGDPTAPAEAPAEDTSPHATPDATTEAHAAAPALAPLAPIGADTTGADGYAETRAPTLPPTGEDLGKLSADQLSRHIKPEDTEDDAAASTRAFGLVLVTATAPMMIHDSDSDPESEARDMSSCHMVALKSLGHVSWLSYDS